MITYEYKLYSSRRNKKLNKIIDLSAIVWNHCISLHRRYYKLYHKYLKQDALKKHLTKLKKIQKYNYIHKRIKFSICTKYCRTDRFSLSKIF